MTEAKNQKSTARQAADLFDKVQKMRARAADAATAAALSTLIRRRQKIDELVEQAPEEVREVFKVLDKDARDPLVGELRELADELATESTPPADD